MTRRDQNRADRIVRLHAEGMTLQEIGGEYGISRERVRQILKLEGVTSQHGGRAIRRRKLRLAREQQRMERRSLKTFPIFGCDWETFVAMNDGLPHYNTTCPASAYVTQRKNAMQRGIAWEITFPEWCRVWEESGHWDERGRSDGDRYVMSRMQDFGPYAVWNVEITTVRQNVINYQAELKVRGVVCADGRRRLPEKAEQLGVAA